MMALATVTTVTTVTSFSNAWTSTALIVGSAAILFLVLLLASRVVLSTHIESLPPGRDRQITRATLKALGVAVPPLMAMFAIVVALRLYSVL